ncbi:MAG: SseB family protein [Christensenellales bacterium]|jgi:hypothetical protein
MITSSDLEDGKILTALIERIYHDNTGENLFGILRCLRDSIVWVPMVMKLSEEDVDAFLTAKKGDTVSAKHDIKMKPDILQRGDVSYFPVFSQLEQIPDGYRSQFSFMQFPFIKCIDMMAKHPNVEQIVINAFTYALMLTKTHLGIVKKLPSELSDA